MGLFNAIFGKQQQKLIARMKNAANFAKFGLAEKMLAGMTDDRRSIDERGKIISAAINTVFSEENQDATFRRFSEDNRDAISLEIDKLRDDQESRLLITQAVRVLVKIEGLPEKIRTLEKLVLLVDGSDEPDPSTFFDLVRSFCKSHMREQDFRQIAARI